MACSTCKNWQPINRHLDEKAHCPELTDHDYVEVSGAFLRTHRDFSCPMFKCLDAYRDTAVERLAESWHEPVVWFAKEEERF